MYPPNGILYQPLTVLVYSTAVDGWNGVEESGAKQSISIVRSYFCFENHMYVCACVCSCVCREREGERAWERAGNYREAVRPHTTPLPAWGSSAIGLTLTYSLSTWGHFWPQMRQARAAPGATQKHQGTGVDAKLPSLLASLGQC